MLSSYFPLKVWDEPKPAHNAPRYELWLSKKPSVGPESLDPQCRAAQALFRFKGIDAPVVWKEAPYAALGDTLPMVVVDGKHFIQPSALPHLVTGKKPHWDSILWPENFDWDESTSASSVDPAIVAAVRTALIPAVLVHTEIEQLVEPAEALAKLDESAQTPLLHQLAIAWLDARRRPQAVAAIQKFALSSDADSWSSRLGLVSLDWDAIENDGIACLTYLDICLRNGNGAEWFSSNGPSPLDALIYALVSLLASWPRSSKLTMTEHVHRRCPYLLRWVKSKNP